jgi:putative FmdB family regulatory protein
MPTYEYECSKCGHEFEAFQSMTADALKKCPACGKLSLKRLIGTGGAILFKGSGFYATDYRSESYHKAAKAESDKQKSGKSEPAKTESSAKKKDSADSASKPQKKSD